MPVSEAQPSGTLEPPKEPSSAANYSSESEPKTPDTVADDEQALLKPDPASESEAPASDPAESHEESSQAAVDESAAEPRTFHTRAYDEYMRQGTASESEAQESEAVEVVKQSSLEDDTRLALRSAGIRPLSLREQSPLEPDLASASEPQSPAALFRSRLEVFSRSSFMTILFPAGALSSPVFSWALCPTGMLRCSRRQLPCSRSSLFCFPIAGTWWVLAITTAVVGLPQVLALRSGNARAGASLIHWGYTLGNVPVSQVVKYLGFTFGLKWVLILVGLLFFSWRSLALFIAIFSLFLLTFCFQFSDEALANHKFLNIWLVLANLFVAYGLWRLWHAQDKGLGHTFHGWLPFFS